MAESEATVLEVNVEVRRLLGRKPHHWLVSKGWALVEMNSRRQLDSGQAVEHVVDNDLDHAEVAAAACLEAIGDQGHDVVELTVDFGNVDHLAEATRKHMLGRIVSTVRAQKSGISIYVGWG